MKKLALILPFAVISPLLVAAVPDSFVTGQEQPDSTLRIAACQFPVSADIRENASWITLQMNQAADSGAAIVHFPECALSGYPGVDLQSLNELDLETLVEETRRIQSLAAELNIWVLVGSVHWLDEETLPMNSLYLIDPSGKIADRYDKRFCTKGDLEYFSAGNHPVMFTVNGVRCGLLICFDVRFPELYREYSKLGADVIFQSFYNARQKPGGIHPKIMPVTAQARAGTNHFYLSLTNSSYPNSWPCHFITPDGLVRKKLEANTPGILVTDIDLSEKYYDASRHFRDAAIGGSRSSAPPPDHPRYTDRKGL